MHELSIVESLLSLSLENAKKADAHKILKIFVVVGEYSGVVDESISFYFSFLSKNTIAAEAGLVFKHIKAELRCRNCDIIFPAEKQNFHCPNCNEQKVEMIGGSELYLESIEVE